MHDVSRKDLTGKEIIICDLDGTLTESKTNLSEDMGEALRRLLAKKKLAVMGGGSYAQFEKQLLAHFSCPPELLKNLYLLPTSGARLYVYEIGWREIYAHTLSSDEKQKILETFESVFTRCGYTRPKKAYGDIFEDRGTQIAFSPLGQNVVEELGPEKGVAVKELWNGKYDALRQEMVRLLGVELSEFEVRSGGLTTIDVTKKGIDKAYGVRQIETHLRIPKSQMFFIGDALYEGGNDYPVLREGVDAARVGGPDETREIIELFLT